MWHDELQDGYACASIGFKLLKQIEESKMLYEVFP